MNRLFLLPLTPVLMLLLSGCSLTGNRAGTAEPKRDVMASPAAPAPERTVSFKTGPNLKVGFKYKLISEGEIKVSDTGAPTRMRETEDYELIKIENDEYTWKRLQTDQVLDMGDNTWQPGEGPSKNRLSLVVEDAYGNTLRTEGEKSAATVTEGKEYPVHPLTIGDSWHYTEVRDDKTTQS